MSSRLTLEVGPVRGGNRGAEIRTGDLRNRHEQTGAASSGQNGVCAGTFSVADASATDKGRHEQTPEVGPNLDLIWTWIGLGTAERGRPINAERVREAAETGAETLAVACPFCTVMLDDGVREAGAELRVADVSTLLVESLE